MATEAGAGDVADFGAVSRTAGRVFHAVLLVAALVGIVALGILLVYVTIDAVQPLTADAGWYLVGLAGFVLPTAATGLVLRRRSPGTLRVGTNALGIAGIGLLFGAGTAALFVDVVAPLDWLSHLLALVPPLAFAVATERSRRVPFAAKLVGTLVLLVGSLLVLPGTVASIPVIPTGWAIMVLSLGLPASLAIGRYTARRWGDRRQGALAGGLALGATVAAAFVGPLLGIGPVPAVVLAVTTLLPVGLYAGMIVRDDPARRVGLVLPVVLVGTALLAIAVAEAAGFAGPNSWVDWQFLTSNHSNDAERAGVYPALVGSIMLMIIVALVSFPLGVGAAVYLEEYAPDNRITRLITINISNLAGVPSIVYGLLGLGLFIRYAGAAPGTVVVGGLTLALLILPIVIISAQEAVRSVPDSLRQASYGMGATRWQTVRNVVLPRAFPGILTGTILALGRAIGETAPLLVIGAANVADLPTDLSSRVVAMPLQIFVWATTFAGPDFYAKAVPAAVIVLLVVLLAMNSVAIVLRNRYQRGA